MLSDVALDTWAFEWRKMPVTERIEVETLALTPAVVPEPEFVNATVTDVLAGTPANEAETA